METGIEEMNKDFFGHEKFRGEDGGLPLMVAVPVVAVGVAETDVSHEVGEHVAGMEAVY